VNTTAAGGLSEVNTALGVAVSSGTVTEPARRR
jgi:hypothetical protein